MKEKAQQDLYNAIRENIMSLRVDIRMGKIEDVDAALSELISDIWKDQQRALRIID
jgi:uncharacterized protein (DUF2267 family)